MNREDLLAQLPEKHVADRLITRYFGAKSPAQRELKHIKRTSYSFGTLC